MKKLYYLVLSILFINCGEPTLEDRISEAKKNRHFHDNTGFPIGIDVTDDDDQNFLLNGKPFTGTIYKEYKTGDLRWEQIIVDGIEHQYIEYDKVGRMRSLTYQYTDTLSTFLGIKLGKTFQGKKHKSNFKGYWVREYSKYNELGVRRKLSVTRWSEIKDEYGNNKEITERTEWDREGNKTSYSVYDQAQKKRIIDEEY